ncbi:Ypq2p [Sugiyamaella lignohabitans]|uniref:Ypq2p n=1 Tax=Sugiyamaella lignohabitans TaxID=796027 RepID=A0A167CBY2_9ASCO|nr:Ypq2p [Sugiyamaella lignohabitans]ANB11483.1 Ypq2p [Sugiyamaella lignohabitans]
MSDLATCNPHENGIALINWIYFISGGCVYGHMSELSWVASTVSVTGWISAGLYQIYLMYMTKRAAGFSALFLLCWVIGDITNVIGCYYTDQMTFQKILSTSSLMLDSTLMMQYFYYKSKHPEIGCEDDQDNDDLTYNYEYDDDVDMNKDGTSVHLRRSGSHSPPILSMLERSVHQNHVAVPSSTSSTDNSNSHTSSDITGQSSSSGSTSSTSNSGPSTMTTVLLASALAVRGATAAPLVGATAVSGTPLFDTHMVGTVCAWICQSLYTFSPLPQIVKNYRHRSTGGVSMALFLADMIGNLGYSLSILAASRSILNHHERSAFLLEELPYLAGTATTFTLELALLWQYMHYGTTSASSSPTLTSTVYFDGESLSPLTSQPQETTQLLDPHSSSSKKSLTSYSTVSV